MSLLALAAQGLDEVGQQLRKLAGHQREIGGEQAQNILLQHAEDPDPEVRKSIRIGLALIQEKLNAA